MIELDTDPERALLFALIALQGRPDDRNAVMDAFVDWTADRSRPIAVVMQSRGVISEAEAWAIAAMVRNELERRTAAHADRTVVESVDAIATAVPADAHETAPMLDRGGNRDEPKTFPHAVRFRRLRLHARGGLGEVFVAHDHELNREVALKEIQDHHADNPASRSRFLLEAEITGGLEHPGIVPVYGLGHYADGRPYYAMRFIEGDSLAESVARFHEETGKHGTGVRMLALQKLLRRFLDVCNAMAYAHSRGVLHRDLKPGNIMVGKYGETLVVDWGLAKAAGRGDDGAGASRGERPIVPSGSGSERTLPGSAVGTPGYMSPEQAAGELDRLGPASDVYSLGATLYHILTGKAPFHGRDLASLLEKVHRGEFAPPRAASPWAPRPLEAICLKAMANRPEDRYPTPLALAADIERWLADEAVEAMPDGWAARAARWGRRHRSATRAAAATLAIVAVVASLAAFLIDQSRVLADSARTQAETALAAEAKARVAERAAAAKEVAAREDAERAAATARRAVDFLVAMFNASDPLGLGELGFRGVNETARDLTARDVLARGAARVAELKDQPLVQAKLMATIGNVYRSMTLFDQAKPLLDGALALRTKHGASDLDLAESYHDLGLLEKDQLDFDAAERDLRRASSLRIAVEGDHPVLAADTWFHLAWLLADRGEAEEAEALFRRAVDARRGAGMRRELAKAQLGLAGLLLDQERNDEASPLIAAAAPVFLTREGFDKVGGAVAFFLAGVNFENNNQWMLADQTLRRGLELARAALPEGNPYIGFYLYELANVSDRRGKFADAERYFADCLALLKKTATLSYPRSSLLIRSYALFLARRGKPAAGKALHDESVAAIRARYGEHIFTADALYRLGSYLLEIGDAAGAEREYRAAAALYSRSLKKGTMTAAECYTDLGRFLFDRGRSAEAIAPFRQAAMIAEGLVHGRRIAMLGVIHTNLGRALAATNDDHSAERELLDAISLYRSAPANDPTSDDVADPLEALASVQRDRGRYAQAEPLYRESIEHERKRSGASSERVAALLEERAKALVDLGRVRDAIPLFEEVVAIRTSHKRGGFGLAVALRNLAAARLLAGDTPGYRATRARLLAAFSTSNDRAIILAIAWAYALGPAGGDDLAPLRARAGAALGPEHKDLLAALSLRAGKVDDAVKLGEEAFTASKGAGSFPLAIALAQLGRLDRAREVFAASVAAVEARRPGWEGRVRVKLEQAEAAALLEKTRDRP